MSVCQIAYGSSGQPPVAIPAGAPIQPQAGSTAAVSCGQLATKRPLNSDTTVSVIFENKSNAVRLIKWIDYEGVLVDYARLDPGQSYEQVTFLTHPWMFTDEGGNCLRIYEPQVGVAGVWIQ